MVTAVLPAASSKCHWHLVSVPVLVLLLVRGSLDDGMAPTISCHSEQFIPEGGMTFAPIVPSQP